MDCFFYTNIQRAYHGYRLVYKENIFLFDFLYFYILYFIEFNVFSYDNNYYILTRFYNIILSHFLYVLLFIY